MKPTAPRAFRERSLDKLWTAVADGDNDRTTRWLNRNCTTAIDAVYLIAFTASRCGWAITRIAPGPIEASAPIYPDDAPRHVIAIGQLLAAGTMGDDPMVVALASAVVETSIDTGDETCIHDVIVGLLHQLHRLTKSHEPRH